MTRKILWVLFAALAIIIGLYPGIYFLVERNFGLLSSKPIELLTNAFWNIGFYTHIIFGGLALLIGWTQFNSNFRDKNLVLHRRLGMVYIIAVVLSSITGIYIGFFATGGLPSSSGFICLGVTWLATTVKAYTDVRNGSISSHQKMMIYSYASCFAAVTLRIWLPLLVMIFGDFTTAYIIVAWLCWIPNLLVAYLISKRIGTTVMLSSITMAKHRAEH